MIEREDYIRNKFPSVKNWVASRIRAFVRDFGTSRRVASVESVSMKRADWLGTGQGKLDYELGINRRNKLCRWIEVAGKIEFADSTTLVGEKGPDKKKKKKGKGKKKKKREGEGQT